jgi:eukaryotic-like serine/threonine-protein kinase
MGTFGSTPLEHDATLGPGTLLGKYQIVRLLGAGGMGAVYEAAHTEIGKRVAVKVLSPAIAAVPGTRARFLREAQLTSRLRHPNIVDVTDMGSDAGQTFLVMELLSGEDLAQRIGRTGPLASQDLADIMLPVCSGVIEAHRAGITHRDLKPQNIFLADGPHALQPKILDFGISKGNDVVGTGSLTGTGAMIGTPFYLAPEQIMDARAAGPQSDQYALGVIMYECLTGSRPFEADSLFVVFQAIVAGEPVAPRQRRPEIPAALEAIVLRAMSVDPAARFHSTIGLGRALLPFASGRMQSIWQEAFTGPDGDDQALAPPRAPPPRSSATMTPRTAVMPGSSSSASGGIQTPRPTGRSAGRAFDTGATDLRSGYRSPWKLVGVVGALVAAAAVVLVLVLGRGTRPDPARGAARGALAGNAKQSAAAVAVHPVVSGPVGAAALARAPAVEPAIRSDPAPVTRPASEPPRAPVEPSAVEPSAAEPFPPPVSAPATFQASVTVEPDTAEVEFDGEPAGQGTFERTLPLDHARHKLRFTAEGYNKRTIEFSDAPPPAVVRLRRDRRFEERESNDSRPGSFRPTARESDDPQSGPPRPTRPPRPSMDLSPGSLNANGAPVID